MKELKLKEKDEKHLVPLDAYNKLKSHLTALHRRHQAFRDMIFNNNNNGNFINTQQSNQSMSNYINYQSSVPILNIDENDDYFQVSSKNLAKETYNYPSAETDSTEQIKYQMVSSFFQFIFKLMIKNTNKII